MPYAFTGIADSSGGHSGTMWFRRRWIAREKFSSFDGFVLGMLSFDRIMPLLPF